jgi:excisionase family DNA binding protein
MDLLTATEAAEFLGLSQSSLEKYRRQGFGPAFVRVGRRAIRYPRASVEAWLAQRCSAGTRR